MLSPEDLPEALFETGAAGIRAATGYHDALKQAKRAIVIRALEEAHGNYTEAAKRLGLHPTNLHRLIRNLDLRSALKK